MKIFTLLADWLTYGVFKLEKGNHFAESLHFFIEDISKLFVMLVILIYIIGLLRSTLDIERVRNYLQGKNRFLGYILGATFGAITPFCSCSSIPLFLGFTAARIPVGITMSFLITSPMVYEVAVLLLGATLGVKFTIIYVALGITSGVIGGYFFDLIKAERFFTPLAQQSLHMAESGNMPASAAPQKVETTWKKRHAFAKNEVKEIVGRIWKWIFIGIGVGALFHGFVPAEWVEKHLNASNWYTVPIASVIGIPLYANATSIIPIAESMLQKGVPVGTTITFMMSVVGASFPEFVLLKQVMKIKLLVMFFFLLLVLFTISGWILNTIAF